MTARMTENRTYLDWNATTPLRVEAKAAMIAAMDVVGNPSSVHSEGRAAKAIVETARAQIAEAFGASGADIVFTSSATEAAALAMAGRELHCAGTEHDAVSAWAIPDLPADGQGQVSVATPAKTVLQLANSETGIIQDLPNGLAVTDATQAFGKIAVAFNWLEADAALGSAHKLGGPKGVGVLILKSGLDVQARIRGGGQEMGRRAGTENVVGIAGFGAAAQAAVRDLGNGVWDGVAELRDLLEQTLADAAPDTIFVGKGTKRLPNTSCIATAGWKGETQVMLMDLAGFSISAGSACSSGKVKSSSVLQAMGYGAVESSSAIRVSLGPATTKNDVHRFAETWIAANKKFRAKAA
jgi:cysteine desulfurase